MDPDNPTDRTVIQVHVLAQPLVSWGLAHLVQSAAPAMRVGSESSTVADCLAALQPDGAHVVLLDLDAPGMPKNIADLVNQGNAQVLVLTGSTRTDVLDNAILAGARGVVSKDEQPATLIKAIERVQSGEIWLDRETTGRIFMQLVAHQEQPAAREIDSVQMKIDSLTRRERQTVEALAADASSPGKVVADRLHISEHTLRNHLTAIYDKLDIHNRVELYAFAHQHGLVNDRTTSQVNKIDFNAD
jgi:two-component system nitrate/nitrite response regulator NarL